MCNVHGSRYFFMDSNFKAETMFNYAIDSAAGGSTGAQSASGGSADESRMATSRPVLYDRLGRVSNNPIIQNSNIE